MENNNKPTVFSGVQPSGVLHIGNYLGALTQWVEMQNQYNCIFCVVDYHAITVKQEPKELSARILDVVRTYLAAGINPEKAVIFQQSDITAHTELAWILNCITRNSDLTKMTQFKNKSGVDFENFEKTSNILFDKEIYDKFKNLAYKIFKSKLEKKLKANTENRKINNKRYIDEIINYNEEEYKKIFDESNFNETVYKFVLEKFKEQKILFNKQGIGLYDYPVLMAADILLYNTDAVPVGDDQVQHVELCRTLAQRFNREYGRVFKIPEVAVRKQGARIMGLDDPAKKMSKSATSSANYISLTDTPLIAAQKIMRAVTDSGSEIKYDPKKKPAISNLMTIYSLLSGDGAKELEKKYQGKGYGEFKKDLAGVIINFLNEFQIKYNSFSDDEVRQILRDGADKVRPVAEETLKNVKNKLGVN